jgi:hypothetical protein
VIDPDGRNRAFSHVHAKIVFGKLKVSRKARNGEAVKYDSSDMMTDLA